jgi:hypothetical protein
MEQYVSVGGAGLTGSDAIWVMGCGNTNSAGDRTIWNYNPYVATWETGLYPGYAQAIAAAPGGTPYVVPQDGSIWRWAGGLFSGWDEVAAARTAYAAPSGLQLGAPLATLSQGGAAASERLFFGAHNYNCFDKEPVDGEYSPCLFGSPFAPVTPVAWVGARYIAVDVVTNDIWIIDQARQPWRSTDGGATWAQVASHQGSVINVCSYGGTAYGLIQNWSLGGELAVSSHGGPWTILDENVMYSLTCDVSNGTPYAVAYGINGGGQAGKLYKWLPGE